MSVPNTWLAPNLLAAIAKIPEPVPTSKTDIGLTKARSIASKTNCVVVCPPVPKASPGSKRISC